MSSALVRTKSLLTVAAAPATVLAVTGDFFTPVGGVFIVLFAGITALFLGIQVLLSSLQGKVSWLERLFGGQPETAWWWTGSPAIRRHSFWAPVVFGLISVASAHQSFESRMQGGYIAQQLPQLALVQIRMLGEISTNTREIADSARAIETYTRDSKREVSDDPRKELANIGIRWEVDSFLDAIQNGDLRVVELFVQAGMDPLSAADIPFTIRLSQNTKNPEVVLDILVSGGLDVNARQATVSKNPAFGPTYYTLMGWAVMESNAELTEALLAHGADPYAEFETFSGFGGAAVRTTPMQYLGASNDPNAKRVRDLLQKATHQ